ncbi:type II toxin-antitoxin system RelE/ParE family toxin [Pontiella sp.]|uniref:type II toxin-antitoxin system RelE/ParE family toxin n=1 Tax=Pontiella sp. TaxID=2837462 RepID=UPI0035659C6B
MYPVRFHSEAYDEMAEAAKYYERQSEGLGKRFLDAVNTAVRHIQLKPALYTDLLPGRKRCLVQSFPFGIIYRIKNSTIEIIAVAHTSREPNYWSTRR